MSCLVLSYAAYSNAVALIQDGRCPNMVASSLASTATVCTACPGSLRLFKDQSICPKENREALPSLSILPSRGVIWMQNSVLLYLSGAIR